MGKFSAIPKVKLVVSIVSLAAIVAVGVGLGIGNDLAFNRYSAVISHHLAPNGDSSSEEAKQARNMGNQLAREIEREGIVMVKNDGTLPLQKDAQVNVFGHGSVDWYIMSSGSEMVGTDGQTPYDFNSALENYGVRVNQDLANYYLSWHEAKGDSNTIFNGGDSYYQIREPSLELAAYRAQYDKALDFSNTAFFVISRHAGENSDAPHYQNKVNGQEKDETRTYLQISTEEEETLTQLGQDFENVIVIINSTNAMQLDFLERIDGINACLVVGVTGVQGALSIPEIIYGDASPSGHLTDTYPYDHKTNITYYRGNHKFTHQYVGAPSGCTTMGAGGSGFYNTSCYVEYNEGIYVGYRWYETADAEGYWDSYSNDFGTGYEAVVQYPFGYGLSYTTFDWKLEDVSIPEFSSITNEDTIELTVSVTNTGMVAGKDVVEVYLTAPYYEGEIEKSSIKLVAYAKSPELRPGETSNLVIPVECKEFKSYDCYDDNNNGFYGYEMDEGDYVIKLMTDAHHMKEMDKNSLTYSVDAGGIQITTDERTGNTVENRFTGEDAYEKQSIDGSSAHQGGTNEDGSGKPIEMVHRDDFPALLEDVEENKNWNSAILNRDHDLTAPSSVITAAMANYWDNADVDYFGNPVPTTNPTWGAAGDLALIDKGQLTELGKELSSPEGWDDPMWEQVLNQVPFDQAKYILTVDTQYKAPGIAAIGFRNDDISAFQHAEGAAQIGNGVMAPGTSCVGYPSPTVLAQTWNQTLAYMFGKSEGNDMNPAGKDATYAPNCNIHRSPYGGRNSGYQSEDPYLSGRTVANVIRGMGVYGRTTFMKHFVVNDQDFNRMGLYTWLSEQALREIYLRSFEEGIKYGDSTGIMTSFNRLGAIWAGGDEALLQGVLRYEWGFKGAVITDMTENENHMDSAANLRAGGNLNLGGDGNPIVTLSTSSTPRVQHRMRQAIKEYVYAFSHALWKHETYNESADPADAVIVTEPKQAWQWWKPAIVAVDALVYSGLALLAFVVVDITFFHLCKEPKKEKEEE